MCDVSTESSTTIGIAQYHLFVKKKKKPLWGILSHSHQYHYMSIHVTIFKKKRQKNPNRQKTKKYPNFGASRNISSLVKFQKLFIPLQAVAAVYGFLDFDSKPGILLLKENRQFFSYYMYSCVSMRMTVYVNNNPIYKSSLSFSFINT